MAWTPTIGDRSGPLFRRIADALAEDVFDGRLRRGEQLPPQRALANALNVDLSTITHAYREARSRGLIEGRVGQGTFVAETLSQVRRVETSWAAFDLSMNLPPQPLGADLEGRITRGVTAIARESGLSAYLNYREAGGLAEERETAARWLAARIPHADATRLLICPGTQCALSILLSTMTSPGDTILTEVLTYPGMKAAAESARVKLVGVASDASGILPDALKTACRRHKPKALYLVPTIHNPTTLTTTPARRKAIATVLRSTGVKLIEDDAYGPLEPDAVPIAAQLPEHTFYAATVSKCIAPGMRVSFLLVPDKSNADALGDMLRAHVQMAAPLMIALVSRWLAENSFDAVVAAIREEARARQKLATHILAGRPFAARPNGHHLWLPLPAHWTPTTFVAHVRRRGIAIVGSDAFAVGGSAPNAVRVALGAASSRAELGEALSLLVAAWDSPPRAARVV